MEFLRPAPTTESFLISAGEASGDTYGAQLIHALRRLVPRLSFFGMGGPQMQAAGCDLVVHANKVAVVGLVEVLKHLPQIYSEFRSLMDYVRSNVPTAAVLIDFPDFNLRLARKLHQMGIPVFYFVSPQVWAWRSSRIKQIQKYVQRMIVIFPFERDFYKKHGVTVSYVGHPLAYSPDPEVTREEFATQYKLASSKRWIALMPGSRKKEVQLNLPAMVEAARLLGRQYEYVLPLASTLQQEKYASDSPSRFWNWLSVTLHSAGVNVTLTDDSRSTVRHSAAAVIASGTATVEAALLGTPFVVVYRLSPLTWFLGRRLVKLDTFAMPNLVAGKRVVKELIQHDFTPQNVAHELKTIIPEGSRRRQMIHDLAQVREQLRESATAEQPAQRAAQEILRALGGFL
ncbi:MAG TPA: lipid-A-disaccharide synthase [Candidatus Angelobacter sp.]